MFKVPEPHDEWLDAFLMVREPPAGTENYWFSTFSAVVRDARQATGRDLRTGEIQDESKVNNWLGALAYLVMLDQIGGCFEPIPIPRATCHEGAIPKALTYFQPALQDQDILAIYALRCAFTHDYALVNVGQGKLANQLTHHFLLMANKVAPLVAPPSQRWDGMLNSIRRANETRVNLRRLGNLAEQVVTSLQDASSDRRLTIVLKGGIDELFARYSVSSFPDPLVR